MLDSRSYTRLLDWMASHFPESLAERAWHCRSPADKLVYRGEVAALELWQQPHPNSRYSSSNGHLLILDHLGEWYRSKIGTWHDEACTTGHTCKRKPPGIGVEHRDHLRWYGVVWGDGIG